MENRKEGPPLYLHLHLLGSLGGFQAPSTTPGLLLLSLSSSPVLTIYLLLAHIHIDHYSSWLAFSLSHMAAHQTDSHHTWLLLEVGLMADGVCFGRRTWTGHGGRTWHLGLGLCLCSSPCSTYLSSQTNLLPKPVCMASAASAFFPFPFFCAALPSHAYCALHCYFWEASQPAYSQALPTLAIALLLFSSSTFFTHHACLPAFAFAYLPHMPPHSAAHTVAASSLYALLPAFATSWLYMLGQFFLPCLPTIACATPVPFFPPAMPGTFTLQCPLFLYLCSLLHTTFL